MRKGRKDRYCHVKLEIPSWNVRGLGNKERRAVVKDTLRRSKVDVAILQGTQMKKKDEILVKNVGRKKPLFGLVNNRVSRFSSYYMRKIGSCGGGDFGGSISIPSFAAMTISFYWVSTGMYGPPCL